MRGLLLQLLAGHFVRNIKTFIAQLGPELGVHRGEAGVRTVAGNGC